MFWTSEYSVIKRALNHLNHHLERAWIAFWTNVDIFANHTDHGKRHQYLAQTYFPGTQLRRTERVRLRLPSNKWLAYDTPLGCSSVLHSQGCSYCRVITLEVFKFLCLEANPTYPRGGHCWILNCIPQLIPNFGISWFLPPKLMQIRALDRMRRVLLPLSLPCWDGHFCQTREKHSRRQPHEGNDGAVQSIHLSNQDIWGLCPSGNFFHKMKIHLKVQKNLGAVTSHIDHLSYLTFTCRFMILQMFAHTISSDPCNTSIKWIK